MTYFLTSCTSLDRVRLNTQNGFVGQLRGALPTPCAALFVCSDPDEPAGTDGFAASVRESFEDGGFAFSSFDVLDRRTRARAGELVKSAEMIVLAGGHVPTQNRFFRELRLKKLLYGFDGVLIGISAGSMNSAETVYAQPELPGEATDPNYQRFLPGLGLTHVTILPHYQAIRDEVLDGLRVMEDVAYPDSVGRRFYALCDGSYILGNDDGETLYGEAYLIADGTLTKLNGDGETLALAED